VASSTAELTLLLKAKILAQGAVDGLSLSLDKVKGKAADVKRGLGELGSGLSAGLGNLTENLLTGQDFGQAAMNLGAFLAGETVQEFGTSMIQKLAGSAVVQAIGGALAGLGSTIGTVITTAIPIGMAAAPAIILAALVAAIAFLIANPEIRDKVLGVAGDIVRGIVGGLASLGGALLDLFVGAFKLLVDATLTFVTTVVGFYLSIPGRILGLAPGLLGVIGEALRAVLKFAEDVVGKIVDVILAIPRAVGNALEAISKLTDVPLPGLEKFPPLQYSAPGGARGGVFGLHGPELIVVGEEGPELVTPNDQTNRALAGGPSVRLVGVTEDDMIEMIERGMYFRLAAAGTD
jgi:hypothetical protein